MNYILTMIFIVITCSINVFSKPVFSFGSTGMEYGKANCVDSKDNIIIGALYQNTINVNPDGQTNLTSIGGVDGAIVKYDKTGKLIWGKSFGGANQSTDVPHGVAVDGDDNIYFCGYFGVVQQIGRTADFDPSNNTFNLTSSGGFDCFISKWDKDGNFKWAKKIANSLDTTEDRAWDLAVDKDGNSFVTGAFKGTMVLGNGVSLTAKGTGFDIFLIKYKSNGDAEWAKTIDANLINLFTEGYGTVDLDSDGNLIWVGNFRNISNLNPMGGNTVTSAGQTDIFMIKLSATDGNFIWGYKVGGTGADVVSPGAMRIDGNNNFFFTGRFAGTSNFNPKGTNNISSGSMYLASFTKDCDYRFAFAMTSSTPGSGGHRVDFDKQNNVFVSGWMRGSTNFNAKGTNNLTSLGTQDIFVAKYDNNGNFIWANNYGATGNTGSDICAGLAVDSEGSAWLTGQFYGVNADYDPFPTSQFLLSSVGQNDCFVLKYDKDGNLWKETTPPTKYKLTVTNGTGSGDYEDGTKVFVTANTAQQGYRFDRWTGDIQYLVDILRDSTIVTIPANDVSVKAEYTLMSGIDTNSDIEICIYPNPASDCIHISGFTGKVEISNHLEVKVWDGEVSEGQFIDIRKLQQGVYYLRIEFKTFKFIKL